MVNTFDTATISLWGRPVGAVTWLRDKEYAVFEYDPTFYKRGLDISPIHMPIRDNPSNSPILFSFPALNKDTFLGLPGLLADALPDKFGNHIIDAWLARQGRDAQQFSPVERLCYTGKRAMGALEFTPATTARFDNAVSVDIADMVELAQKITQSRASLNVELSHSEQANTDAISDILRIGTSAGGARPKAVIAMNQAGHVVSGQATAPAGYDYWLIKFDGVSDLELGAPHGFGRIEYAYYLMAKDAGINMSECQLLEENGRAHFLTKRFDRQANEKLHLQSLCGLAHYDFNQAGGYSYEQAFSVMRQLRLSKADAEQQFRRMVFNVIARNQDDHTKNIAFLLQSTGQWQLSPAYDMTYAHNPAGMWTNQHQMTVNGKRDNFNREDFRTLANSISLKKPEQIIEEIETVVARWPQYAKQANVPNALQQEIAQHHRLSMPP